MTRLKLLLPAGLLVVATFAIPATSVDDARVVAGPTASRIDEYLSRAKQFGFSGTVLVADSSRVLLNMGYGWANEALRVPNTAGTILDIGSITKTFTTNAILKLASEGLLGVHDSLRRFFPDAPSDKRNITLHHLMTHTSGIEDPPIGDYDPVTLDSLRKVVFAGPLLSPPGTGYNYSNAGITLLAMVIARVTGMDFETFLRERLLLPRLGSIRLPANASLWIARRRVRRAAGASVSTAKGWSRGKKPDRQDQRDRHGRRHGR